MTALELHDMGTAPMLMIVLPCAFIDRPWAGAIIGLCGMFYYGTYFAHIVTRVPRPSDGR